MFNRTTPQQESPLENAINSLLKEMDGFSGTDAEYAQMADQLVKLYNLKSVDNQAPSNAISRDALVTAAANIVGILLIVNFEKASVLTSKALNLLLRFR